MRKSKYSSTGPQRFPGSDSSGLPADRLTLGYALNLLPHARFHDSFFEMMVSCVGLPVVIDAVAEAVRPVASQAQTERILKAEDSSDLTEGIIKLLELKESIRIEKEIRIKLTSCLEAHIASRPDCKEYHQRTQHLCQMLDLSEKDLAVIELAVVYKTRGSVEKYFDTFPLSDWTALIASVLRMTLAEARKRLARNGTLIANGWLEFGNKDIVASNAIFEYLAGISDDVFTSDDFSAVPASAFTLESFPITEKDRAILLETLRNPGACHLFFYGRPGTGKTELAKALASEAGRSAVLVKYKEDGDEKDRRAAMSATRRVAPIDVVLIIDEADVLLNTATVYRRKMVDKGWINNFMDECRHKVIWIANETGEIETSVLRRFSYSLEFKKFTTAQRISAWKTQLTEHPLSHDIPPELIERLAREYEVDAGGIASAIKATESVLAGRPREAVEIEKTLGSFLEHHEKLSGVRRQKKKLNRLSENYDVGALNTDLLPTDLVADLRVREKNSMNGRHSLPANIMFWGLPGTGKTEFAKYIAQELGKELLVKRMSDLQSMYVGETEKRIAEAFNEAAREGAVLFLDEADSLILDRKTAVRSWESSQTNEVLTQMENFSGICICCTNLLDGLDEAALRRFTWKIKFLPLTAEGAETLFRKYFQSSGRLSGEVKTALRAIRDLTPGDFKTVWQRQQYSGVESSGLDVVKALKQEVSYKRSRSARPIGFSA